MVDTPETTAPAALRGDQLSSAILDLLRADPTMPISQVARTLGVSRTSVYEHLRRINEQLDDEEAHGGEHRQGLIRFDEALGDLESGIRDMQAEIESLHDLDHGVKRTNAIAKAYDTVLRAYGLLTRLRGWSGG